jgi:hypothetical protein
VFENPPRTPVLVRVENEELRIEYAIYTSWLKSILPSPTRGQAFATWFYGKNASDEMIAKANTNVITSEPFSRRAHDGRLYVRPLTVSKSVRIIELRLGD